jgi:hypothetical protein
MINIDSIPGKDDTAQRICDAAWNGWSGRDIKILSHYTYNSMSHKYDGTILVNDIEYGFVARIAEADFWLEKFGLADGEVSGCFEDPEPPESRTFIPINSEHRDPESLAFKIYLVWRQESWFIKMMQDYNYDRYVQPGTKTENYYRSLAEKRGLKPGYLSDLSVKAREILKATPVGENV